VRHAVDLKPVLATATTCLEEHAGVEVAVRVAATDPFQRKGVREVRHVAGGRVGGGVGRVDCDTGDVRDALPYRGTGPGVPRDGRAAAAHQDGGARRASSIVH
jgi:hypothetical protein